MASFAGAIERSLRRDLAEATLHPQGDYEGEICRYGGSHRSLLVINTYIEYGMANVLHSSHVHGFIVRSNPNPNPHFETLQNLTVFRCLGDCLFRDNNMASPNSGTDGSSDNRTSPRWQSVGKFGTRPPL